MGSPMADVTTTKYSNALYYVANFEGWLGPKVGTYMLDGRVVLGFG